MIVYRFPKDRLVYGPKQIVARINQDTEISRQVSLWDQRGSQVIQGTLLVIPVENSLIYVQPLYLVATDRVGLPELRRVIVAFGNQLLMEPNLEAALAGLFGGRPPETGPTVATAGRPATQERTTEALSREALDHYRKAQRYVREGNWEAYGAELRRLEQALEDLARRP